MRSVIPVFAAVLAIAAPLEARHIVRTAKHTYYIDVRNEQFRTVNEAWVDVWEQGDYSARVQVRAPGYRETSEYVSIRPDQPTIHVDARVQDPNVQVQVTDAMGTSIPGVWVDQNQFSANADEYMVSLRLDRTGFEKFGAHDVRVDFVFGSWVQVMDVGNQRRVDIRVPRRQMGSSYYVNLRVRIPTDQQIREGTTPRDAVRAERFEALHADSM